MPSTNKAVAYLRVSTNRQKEEGGGLQLQAESIQAYADEAGIEILHVFSDAYSGVGEDSYRKRSGLREALEMARKKGVPVIVDSLSRLSRHTATVNDIITKENIDVIVARDESSDRRAVLVAQARRDQAHAERISQQTKLGLQRAKERGAKLGNRTNLDEAQKMGAAVNKQKAEQAAQELAPVVDKIKQRGLGTKGEIASELNKLGYRTVRGGEWSATNIRRLLERIEAHKELKTSASNSKTSVSTYKSNPDWGMF